MTRPTLTPEQNLARAAVLDDLARLDGRGDPCHPHVGTFTGLGRPFTRLTNLEAALEAAFGYIARLEARLEALEPEPHVTIEDYGPEDELAE